MTYDPLRRILSKTHRDGTPAVSYQYYLAESSAAPNIGQLQSVSSTVASTVYGFSWLGKASSSTHTISGYTGNLIFGYDWSTDRGHPLFGRQIGRQIVDTHYLME